MIEYLLTFSTIDPVMVSNPSKRSKAAKPKKGTWDVQVDVWDTDARADTPRPTERTSISIHVYGKGMNSTKHDYTLAASPIVKGASGQPASVITNSLSVKTASTLLHSAPSQISDQSKTVKLQSFGQGLMDDGFVFVDGRYVRLTPQGPIPGHTRITELAPSVDVSPAKEEQKRVSTIAELSEGPDNKSLYATATPKDKEEPVRSVNNDDWNNDAVVEDANWAKAESVHEEKVDHMAWVEDVQDSNDAPLENMPTIHDDKEKDNLETMPHIEDDKPDRKGIDGVVESTVQLPINMNDPEEPKVTVIDFNDKIPEIEQARAALDDTRSDLLYRSVHEAVDIDTWLEGVHPGSFPIEPDNHNYSNSPEGSNNFHSMFSPLSVFHK